jgi:hypothetical protein
VAGRYLCSLKFAINLALVVEFGGAAGGCHDHLDPHDNSTNSTHRTPQCISSQALLDDNDVDAQQWYIYAGVLAALFVGFRVLAAVLLASKAK